MMPELNDLEIAVAHENYYARGGGERVAEAVATTFDAPLYWGFGDPDKIPDNDNTHHRFDVPRPVNWLSSKSPLFRDLYQMFTHPYLPELHDYDVVVETINNVGWYVPPDTQAVVRYMHSTPRAAFDRYPDKGGNPILDTYALATRVLFQHTTAYPDIYVCNSELVAQRCRKYWNIKPERLRVVYPPVDTESYQQHERADYYLVLSRLVRHKKIDEVVEAFRYLPSHKLVVAGVGNHMVDLEEMAPDNVQFLGYVSEEEKRVLLGRAKALIFSARNEDFGMTPIEAMASGTPVIGVREGYTRHQIVDGWNGYLYERGVENLESAIRRFDSEGVHGSRDEIEEFAEKFDRRHFERGMREAVAHAVEMNEVEPGFEEEIEIEREVEA